MLQFKQDFAPQTHADAFTQSLRDIANGLVVAGLRLILYVIVLCWVVGLVGGPPQMLASLNNFFNCLEI